MPGIAGHNSRVRIWPQNNPYNQGNSGTTFPDDYVDMFATRWQFTYRTEAVDATTFEAPRVPFVTPMMTYIGGVTDIEFTIDALWDTDTKSGSPFAYPDLRPGTRPVIDLYIKKGPNDTTTQIANVSLNPGLQGTPNPIEQCIRFTAVIADLTTDSEVRGLVKYTFSGSADPYILDANEGGGLNGPGEYFSTGIWLPSFDGSSAGPAFSSQNMYHSVSNGVEDPYEWNGEDASVANDHKPTVYSGKNPNEKEPVVQEVKKTSEAKAKVDIKPEIKAEVKTPPPSDPLK
jgi:hypothetical protein